MSAHKGPNLTELHNRTDLYVFGPGEGVTALLPAPGKVSLSDQQFFFATQPFFEPWDVCTVFITLFCHFKNGHFILIKFFLESGRTLFAVSSDPRQR